MLTAIYATTPKGILQMQYALWNILNFNIYNSLVYLLYLNQAAFEG